MGRAAIHDMSKFRWREMKYMAPGLITLKNIPYGSLQYKEALEKAKPGIEAHYKANNHHPEFYKNGGVGNFSIMDWAEVLIDWKAAGFNHSKAKRSLWKSIQLNSDRFNMKTSQKRQLEWSVLRGDVPPFTSLSKGDELMKVDT